MAIDHTEEIRRGMVADENVRADDEIEGQRWTTDELTVDFTVQGFLAPFVMVTRKSDGVTGTLMFRHNPRIYYGFAAIAKAKGEQDAV